MKTLLVMRHGKSSWKDASISDYERPLKKRGKNNAISMGEFLKTESLSPDIILCSSARRAKDTAILVSEASGFEGKIKYFRKLYMAASEEYIDLIQDLPDEIENCMVVGHNPGQEELIEVLTYQDELLQTAAVAVISLPIQTWHELNEDTEGELLELWRPRELWGDM